MISQIIIRAVSRAIEAIEEIGVEYAIFGGLALAAWKRLRSTLDIDIMIIIKKEGIDSLISSLLKNGLKLDKERPQVNLGEITLISFLYPDEESLLDIKVDIAVASSGFPERVVHNRIKLNVMGKEMWFVKCEDLIILKVLSGRPIDVVDAKELFQINKEVIDMEYLRKQASELNIEKQLRDIENMSKKGLTLLEILISTLILALVMTGLANLFITGKRYILRSRSRMTGGELGKYFLDLLQMDVRQDQWGNNCLSGGVGCPADQTVDNIKYTPIYNFTDISETTLRKVKVEITWNESSP